MKLKPEDYGFHKVRAGLYESATHVIERCNRWSYQWVLRNKATGQESWQYTLRAALEIACG